MAPPKAVDLSHHLSRSTRVREESNVKKFYKYFSIPGVGQLAGGLPHASYFPYDTLEAKVSLPNRWKPTTITPTTASANKLANTTPAGNDYHSSQLVIPHDSSDPDLLRKIDITTALQYGTAQGYPPLYSFIREFTRNNLHPNVPYEGGPEVILTCGNTDGFSKTVQAFSNEWAAGRDPVWEREGLLVEEYCYMNAVQTARPRGLNIVPVGMDDKGMIAYGRGGLEDILENWDFSKGKRPHLMYTVSIGQNPTGITLDVPRRKEIYAVCVKYDIIIVEDDPYWYLQFPSSKSPLSPTLGEKKSSGFDFLDSLAPSYLSIDYQGRVVRLDTFSKTVAPGCRLGWITAQPAVVERLLRITETSTQQPSGFVQSMIAGLLLGPSGDTNSANNNPSEARGWKVDGWVRWLEGLRGNYERRMNKMCDILDEGKALVKSGRRNSLDALAKYDDTIADWAVVETVRIYDFIRPTGGMFLWVGFDFTTHPLRKFFTLPDLSRALWVFWTTTPYRVLVSPGTLFAPTPEIRDQTAWRFVRLCFAACDDDQIEPISKRFVMGAQDFWRIKSRKKIEELLDEGGLSDEKREEGTMALLTGFC